MAYLRYASGAAVRRAVMSSHSIKVAFTRRNKGYGDIECLDCERRLGVFETGVSCACGWWAGEAEAKRGASVGP